MAIVEKDTLSVIELNDTNRIKAVVKEANDVNYVDVRKYYDDKEGKEKGTTKGIMLTLEQWQTLTPVLVEFLKACGMYE